MRIVMALLVLCFLTACAQQGPVKLYSGAERSASQLVTVRVPADLEIERINGERPSGIGGVGKSDYQSLQLQPGTYFIDGFYKGVFDINGMSTEIIRSRMASFEITGQAGDVWTLAFDRPANLQAAAATRQSFPAWAENRASGERVAARQGDSPATLTSQLLGGIGGSSGASTKSAIDPVQASASASQQRVQPAAMGQPSTLPHDDATLTTLKQLWQMLTPESQTNFAEWIQR